MMALGWSRNLTAVNDRWIRESQTGTIPKVTKPLPAAVGVLSKQNHFLTIALVPEVSGCSGCF